MDKKKVFIDMDGVLVDFEGAMKKKYKKNPEFREIYKKNPDEMPGIFKKPKPVNGAIEAVKKLHDSGKYELFIATTASWKNPKAAYHKRLWIEKHFGKLFEKKMFIAHRKDLLMGDYLIDDRESNGASDFSGELLSFGWAYEKQQWNEYRTWEDILKRLLS